MYNAPLYDKHSTNNNSSRAFVSVKDRKNTNRNSFSLKCHYELRSNSQPLQGNEKYHTSP